MKHLLTPKAKLLYVAANCQLLQTGTCYYPHPVAVAGFDQWKVRALLCSCTHAETAATGYAMLCPLHVLVRPKPCRWQQGFPRKQACELANINSGCAGLLVR